MTWTLTIAYFALAAATTAIVFVASARLADGRRPAGERLGLSVAAGLVWPLMLLGIAEVSSFAMYAKVHEGEDAEPSIDVLV